MDYVEHKKTHTLSLKKRQMKTLMPLIYGIITILHLAILSILCEPEIGTSLEERFCLSSRILIIY